MRTTEHLRRLAGYFFYLPAVLLRKRGIYTASTEKLFSIAARVGDAEMKLAWQLFRRDLGNLPDAAWLANVVKPADLSPARREQFFRLLWEQGAAPPESIHPTALHVVKMQNAWLETFREKLRSTLVGGIYVVGNSPSISGGGLGKTIDRSAFVFRFNHWSGEPCDVGNKFDCWVRSPDVKTTCKNTPRFAILSGPDMQFRMQDWDHLKDWIDGGGIALSVPLGIWKNLVAELEAPPSAGILVLAWLREILGGFKGIHAVGFGFRGGKYHIGGSMHRPSSRHSWKNELLLLDRWRHDGLDLVMPHRR